LHVALAARGLLRRRAVAGLSAGHSGLLRLTVAAGHRAGLLAELARVRVEARLTAEPLLGHAGLLRRRAVTAGHRAGLLAEAGLLRLAEPRLHAGLLAVPTGVRIEAGLLAVARLLRLTVAAGVRIEAGLATETGLLRLAGEAGLLRLTVPGLLRRTGLPVRATGHELRLPEVGLLSRTRGETVAAGGLIHG